MLYVSRKLIPLNKCTLTKLFLFSVQILSTGPSHHRKMTSVQCEYGLMNDLYIGDKEIVHKKLGSLPNNHMGLLT